MTDEQMKAITQQFAGIDRQLEGMNRQFDGIRTDLSQVKTDVGGLKADLGQVKTDVGGLKADLGQVRADLRGVKDDVTDLKADVAVQRTTLERVDAEVHRQGILRESDSHELKMAIETFQTAQRVTNAKIDQLRDSIDHRLVPLEVAVRSHTNTLADHERRLDWHDKGA